jgi:four helix bundle protein
VSVAKSFRELKVWNKSIDLTVAIYELTAEFPKHELYGLTSQMRRAAASSASNFAEGSARGTRRDVRQFVKIARGSNCELQTHLLLVGRLKYAPQKQIDELELITHEIGQMLSGLSNDLESPVTPKASTN